MKNKDILRYIQKNNTWTLGEYNLPILLYYWSGRNIDLKKDHEQRMKNLSRHEEDFIRDISSHNFPYLREFPIPIYSLETWRKYWPKEDHLYFSLDFFFPKGGLVVEIDGSQHQLQRDYDKARDDYLKEEYGLETLRVDEYGWYWPERSQEFLQTLIPQLENSQSYNSFPLPKLNSFIEENWKDRWREELKAIELIEQYILEDGKIKIKKNEFYRLTRGKIRTDPKYMKEFNKLMKNLGINKEIIIP